MVTTELNMTNLRNSKTFVNIGDSGTPNVTKRGVWHVYQKRDGKIHHLMLSDMALIIGLHVNLFSVAQALQKDLQVTLEVESLIIKKFSRKVCFDKKITNNGIGGFNLTFMFYNNTN